MDKENQLTSDQKIRIFELIVERMTPALDTVITNYHKIVKAITED